MSIKEISCTDRHYVDKSLVEEITNIIHMAFGHRIPPVTSIYQISTRMADPDYKVYCYTRTGVVLGVAFLYEPKRLIQHLCVLPWNQKKGIGEALLKHIINNHGPNLQLVVKNRNKAAINLYRRHGFVTVSKKGPAAVCMKRKRQLYA